MNYAIIAAGEGSRLRAEGIRSPKPLVELEGETLLERLIRIFRLNAAERIVIIINSQSQELKDYVQRLCQKEPVLEVVEETTPSSFHSFYAILKHLDFAINELCLTTVDTIFKEEVFKGYISKFQSDKHLEALMAVTHYVDDEKPLWVNVDGNGWIRGFSSVQESEQTLISGGVYCLRGRALRIAKKAMELGVERMRNYQQMLVEEACRIMAYDFGKVLDIDHVSDIEKARAFLQSICRVSCVERARRFSYCCEEKDKALFDKVCMALSAKAVEVSVVQEDNLETSNLDSMDLIVSMARGQRAVKWLLEQEAKGKVSINPPQAVGNCHRWRMNALLQENGIRVPSFEIVSVERILSKEGLDYPNWGSLWIKRADANTETKKDVVFCSDRKQLLNFALDMKQRGIEQVLICKHIEGRLIKLYRISGTPFAEYLIPKRDKFGQELDNFVPNTEVDKEKLVLLSDKVAEILGLEVFGLDIMENKEGRLYVIDVNDFPSFSNWADEAAEWISKKTIELCRREKDQKCKTL